MDLKLLKNFKLLDGSTKQIYRHTIVMYFFKSFSILISFILVPILIKNFGKSDYGLWITISASISSFSFLGFGIGHGLRNNFVKSNIEGNKDEKKRYISTAYISMSFFVILLILLILFINHFVFWPDVFKVPSTYNSTLKILVPLVFCFFVVSLVMKLIAPLYLALQKHSIDSAIGFYISLLKILLVLLLVYFSSLSLINFSLIFGIVPILVYLYLSFRGFNGELKGLLPSVKYFEKKYLKDIFGLGFKIFCVQICMLVIFNTDNILITRFFSTSDVVPYHTSYKLFSIIQISGVILMNPYWSAITKHYVKKDLVWIKKSMYRMRIFSVILMLCAIMIYFFSENIIIFWLGDLVVVPQKLMLLWVIFISMQISYKPYTMFLNGISKVNIHMYLMIIGALINIPLSYYFAVKLDMHLDGILLASIISITPSLIILPIQYKKIMTNTASGIWNT